MKNPIYANANGGILIEQDSGVPLYLDGGLLYEQIKAGAFGAIAPFQPDSAAVLNEAKAARRAAINAARDAACQADVTVAGTAWQADARSQQMLASAITIGGAGLPLPASWRARDNSNMAVSSLSDLLPIAAAIAAQTQAAYEKGWALKAQIDAATTAAEVEAIKW
jgi:hypothetical protein